MNLLETFLYVNKLKETILTGSISFGSLKDQMFEQNINLPVGGTARANKKMWFYQSFVVTQFCTF